MSDETSNKPWLVRTDFSGDAMWNNLTAQVLAPQLELEQEFFAEVECISNGKFEGLDPEAVVHLLPDSYNCFFCMVADRYTFKTAGLPILVIGFAPVDDTSADFRRHPRQVPAEEIKSFRALPKTIQSIENNLSLANLDFDDFLRSVESDGIFRGFPQ